MKLCLVSDRPPDDPSLTRQGRSVLGHLVRETVIEAVLTMYGCEVNGWAL